jgi:isopentenyl-diphosphate Delta-isomerase
MMKEREESRSFFVFCYNCSELLSILINVKNNKQPALEDLKQFEQRKKDHIRWALDSKTQSLTQHDFSGIKLVPQALPELNFSEVSLETKLLNQKVSSPHFISSMTAGHKLGFEINSLLAEAAGLKNWLFCVGSQKRSLINPQEVSDIQQIAKKYKKTKLISNIGLEEVIQFKPAEILKLTNSINAVGLIIHTNALQEVFQNKKDVVMKHGFKSISEIVKKSDVPVIVKEVGFGISSEMAQRLFDVGVSVVDVAGNGGTHWGMIEALRQDSKTLSARAIEHFADWGLSTVDCLLDLQSFLNSLDDQERTINSVWASGGIRSGVDSAKCLALGASAVGLAQPLLKNLIAKDKLGSVDKVIQAMEQFDFELKTAMFCLGLGNVSEFAERKVWYEK